MIERLASCNLKVLLRRRPTGHISEDDFTIVKSPIVHPVSHEFLVRNLWLSVDPYMRLRMNNTKSYAPNVPLGAVMVGDTVGKVVESNHPQFKIGQFVVGRLGWQLYSISDGQKVRKIDPRLTSLSAHLGVLGMPGVTAWIGMLDIGSPREGETVIVSAASGAVGSVAGQIARLQGCRVVGIAGGKMKSNFVVRDLGFDACVDYKDENFSDALRNAVPHGADVYFDNVGGKILDAVLPLLKPFARIPLCGLVSQYDTNESYGVRNLSSLLVNRVKVQGFIVSDHFERWPTALADLNEWFSNGILRYRETVNEGIESAPSALIRLLRGCSLGKQVVKLF